MWKIPEEEEPHQLASKVRAVPDVLKLLKSEVFEVKKLIAILLIGMVAFGTVAFAGPGFWKIPEDAITADGGPGFWKIPEGA